MALIKCPECGAMVSQYAINCISCGCPMSKIKEIIASNSLLQRKKITEELNRQDQVMIELRKRKEENNEIQLVVKQEKPEGVQEEPGRKGREKLERLRQAAKINDMEQQKRENCIAEEKEEEMQRLYRADKERDRYYSVHGFPEHADRCPNCRQHISSFAPRCSNCGFSFNTEEKEMAEYERYLWIKDHPFTW